MLRFAVLVGLVAVAVASVLPGQMPDPSELAFVLSEDEFEDYLDQWLAIEEPKWANKIQASASPRSGCQIRVNGDLGQPQPVYIRNSNYLAPTGTTGVIDLDTGDEVVIACTGSGRIITHPNIIASTDIAIATCVSNTLVSGAGWLNGDGEFGQLICSSNSNHVAEYTGETCYGSNQIIRVGYVVDGEFYVKYHSCFDASRLEVLYTWYDLNAPNAVHQVGVDRPSWLAGSFYPGVAINSLYTLVTQRANIATLVGQELADKYVTNTQYLARGHLSAKTDFIFATGQRSSFYFINAAPQWQPINAGNWNWLEQNVRTRIGAAGYSTITYTGTWGVSQLRDQNDDLVDIYLHTDANNNPQLPVPLYYFKVVYEPTLRLGTAFVSINNPYYSEEEVRKLTFCTDLCRNNTAFSWLNWQPDRIDIGYSFCCTVDDFRNTVPYLPAFTVDGLLS